MIPLLLMTAAGLAPGQLALKDAFKNQFLIGAAVNESQFTGHDVTEAALVTKHFSSITPENVMKWESIHPAADDFNFGPADRYVEFGEQNRMFIIGHTLVWHSQTPKWVFQDAQGRPAGREALLQRMSNHIHSIVGRYRGRVKGWDVVNEALNEDGSLRQSRWLQIIGPDYIVKAFEFAHDADPDAELYYNDYALENPPKRAGAIALVKQLQAAGVKVAAIGSQMHVRMDWPAPPLVDDTLTAFGELGVKVNITELDLDVLPAAGAGHIADVSVTFAQDPALNPYSDGLPDSIQQALAQRYAGLFAVFVKHRKVVGRVTFWGVTDGDSWLNNWPIKGRTNYPLLFDRAGRPKPAFASVLQIAGRVKEARQPAPGGGASRTAFISPPEN